MLKRQINLNMIVTQFYYILSILKFEKKKEKTVFFERNLLIKSYLHGKNFIFKTMKLFSIC